jgi:hypothetical protein
VGHLQPADGRATGDGLYDPYRAPTLAPDMLAFH